MIFLFSYQNRVAIDDQKIANHSCLVWHCNENVDSENKEQYNDLFSLEIMAFLESFQIFCHSM